MSSLIRVAVLGVGSLGKEHARIFAELARLGTCEFVGVYDVNTEAARTHALRHGVRAFGSVAEAAEAADALTIVTPTVTHVELARELLAKGRHLLIEKPMADNAAEASELVELAARHQLILQVGHVERFNPVFAYLEKVARHPRFIECHRLSPYPKRSTDIGVVLDLMIHDLDVILAFVKSPVVGVEGVGIPVLSPSEDIANARLRFANGCVANITASRISPERMRKIRVFSAGPEPVYISLDYRAQEGYVYRLAHSDEPESSLFKKLLSAKDSAIVSEFAGRKIVREPVPIAKEEPLRLELAHFVACVQERRTPKVTGEQARAALEVAFEVTRQIRESLNSIPRGEP
ncbi:MAG: Gfo/Idh/MocA family oxidoreductase [Verrucomicrobiales bacterium]|nr:Gfo/Idh/MocA family oxidoreductase [Verrucomicrobiales bacterium]